MELKALVEQRNALVAQAGTIAQDKNNTPEKREQVRKMFVDIDALQEQIDIAKRLDGFKEESRSAGMPQRGQPGDHQIDLSPERKELEKRAFSNYITGRLKPEDHQYLRTEARDLTVGAPGAVTGGGVLVPIGYDATLHTATKAIGEILSGVKVWTSDTGEGVRISLTDPTALRFALVSEMATVGETDQPLSGFNSYVDTLGFSTRVSNQLLQDSAFSVDGFLSDTISAAWVATASEAIIKGNGSNFQSLVAGASIGYTTPSGDPLVLTYSDLLSSYSALDPSYLPGAAVWVNSKTWSAMLGITDTVGRPILTSDLQGNPFKSIFGLPIRISQAIDNLGASKTPLLLGDAEKSYTYRQAGQLVIRRATERYIEQNATGFFAFQRAGGYVTSQASSPSMIKMVMAAS